jgi:hypothetical protein
MRWFISLLIILGILGGSAYAINQRDKPVYVLDTRTAEYIRYLRPDIDPGMVDLIAYHIDMACLEHGLDTELVVALIAVESKNPMGMNAWIEQIAKDDLEHMESQIIRVADSLGRIEINHDADFTKAIMI